MSLNGFLPRPPEAVATDREITEYMRTVGWRDPVIRSFYARFGSVGGKLYWANKRLEHARAIRDYVGITRYSQDVRLIEDDYNVLYRDFVDYLQAIPTKVMYRNTLVLKVAVHNRYYSIRLTSWSSKALEPDQIDLLWDELRDKVEDWLGYSLEEMSAYGSEIVVRQSESNLKMTGNEYDKDLVDKFEIVFEGHDVKEGKKPRGSVLHAPVWSGDLRDLDEVL